MRGEITITKLQRDEYGVWTARVSRDGSTIPVTRRFGSWGTIPDDAGRWSHLPYEFAAALQKRVRSIERRESSEKAAA